MKYKVAIGNYKKMIRIVIISFALWVVSIILFSISIKYEFLKLRKEELRYILPSALIIFLILFIRNIRNSYSREVIAVEQNKIKSNRFGEIEFKNIVRYKTLSFRGFESLILIMRYGNKYVIGPSNNFSLSSEEEYNRFKKILMKEVNCS